ncbi:MAG: M14 family metallopeptidase [Clostridia bacterium]|nr:M14 family metallopeptidase [Clostridia bacterium]
METIRFGDQSVYVEYIQLALSRLGYSVAIDGKFGTNTLRAVLQLQAARGLRADGIVGPRTWALLLPLLRGFTYHTIQSGDTFFRLAKQFYTTVSAIETANPTLTPENLPVGTRIIIPYGFALIPTGVRYTYFLVKLLVEGLRARYPFIRSGSAGTSVMGHNVYYLVMGNGEKEVFYNASHHANEWITTPLILRFMEEYAKAYAEAGTIYGYSALYLYDQCTLFVIPLVNPDGVDLVNGAIPSDSSFYQTALSYAADYPQIPFPNGWKANIEGIDPNLSYPAYWERAKEIKFSQGYTSPAPRDYVGPAPLASPEAAAVYSFTLAHNFLLTLSYHTQGEVIYWRFLDFLPPQSPEIAEAFANASGYLAEETPLQSGYAGYKDWFILTYNRPGYTIEAGSGINPLPLSQFSKIYADNIGILTLGMAETIERL